MTPKPAQNQRLRNFSSKKLLATAALAFASSSTYSVAANYSWNGGGADNNWSTGANWRGGVAAISSSTNSLIFAGTTRTSPYTNAPFTLQNITFSAGGGPFTLSGESLTFQTGSIVTNSSTALQTINNSEIALTGSSIWATTGGNIAVGSVISGASSLIKTGTGVLILSGNNTYTGLTSVANGTLRLATNNSILSSGTVTVSGTISNGSATWDLNGYNQTIATLNLGSASTRANAINTVATGSGTLAVTGNVTYALASTATNHAGTAQITGNLDLGNTTHTFTVADSTLTKEEVVINAVISGESGFSKAGAGVLVLGGTNNTYTGPTIITAGAIKVTNLKNFQNTNIQLNGGVLELGADLALTSGTEAGQIRWLGTGGFTLSDGVDRTVSYNSGANVKWATDNFVVTNFVLGTINSTNTITFANNIDLNSSTRTVVVNNGSADIDAVLSGTLSNGGLTVSGSGTLQVGNANTYVGVTTISAGTTLIIAKLSNGGVASSIGASAVSATNLTLTNGTLKYVGTGDSTNRGFRIGAGTGARATLDASGVATETTDGAVKFTGTNAITFSSSVDQARILVLTGINTADNLFAGTLNDNGTGAVSIIKNGIGKWIISGTSAFTGTVSVNEGTLSVTNNAALGSTTGGAATVLAGATLNLNNVNIGSKALVLNGFGVSNTGALTITGNSSISGDITLNSDASIGGSGSLDFSGSLLDPNQSKLSKVGSGTMTLSGATGSSAGEWIIDAGTVLLAKSGIAPALTGSNVVINNGGTLRLGGASNDQISSATAVEINTGGVFDLNGRNEGILTLVGAGTVTNTASATTATLTLGNSEDSPTSTFSGTLQNGAGILALTVNGPGTFTFSGSNSFTGVTTINGGTLSITNAFALGSTAGITDINNGGTLHLNNIAALAETIHFQGDGVENNGAIISSGNSSVSGDLLLKNQGSIGVSGSLALNGVVQGNLLNKIGDGTLLLGGELNNANLSVAAKEGTVILAKESSSGVHAATNITVYNGATVRLAGTGSDQITENASVQVNSGGTFDLNGRNEGFATLSGSGTVTNTDDTASTLTVGEQDGTSMFEGALQDGEGIVSLRKVGNGTFTLSGTNTYTGETVVSGGKLIVNGDNSGATGEIEVEAFALLGGSGMIGGATTIQKDAILSPGNSPGTLSFSQSLTLEEGAILSVEGGDLVAVNGLLTLEDNWVLQLNGNFMNGGTTTLFTHDGIAWSNTNPIFDIEGLGFIPTGPLWLIDTGSSIVLHGVSVIPEPSSVLLLASGAGIALHALWRRKRVAA